MSHYPKMLYRRARSATDVTVDVNGAPFGTRIVADADEEAELGARGWAEFADVAGQPLTTAESGDQDEEHVDSNPVAELLRDELVAADEKLRTRETEINLANERIATLEAENAELTAKLGALDADGDGNPGGSKPQDPPALTGKTKAELLQIAADEGAVIEDGALNADIIAAIELKREAGA